MHAPRTLRTPCIPIHAHAHAFAHAHARVALQAPASAQSSDAASAEALALEKIETSQQFFKWFGAIESQMEEEQESSFKKYAETLNKHGNVDIILGPFLTHFPLYIAPTHAV